MKSDFNYHGPVVVFDLDDTLFRERDFCRSGFRYLIEIVKAEFGTVPEGLFEKMNNELCRRKSPFDLFEAEVRPLAEAQGKSWDLKSYISRYRSHFPDISLSDEVSSLLSSLRDRGVVTGIITDGRSATQRNKIRALKLDEFVDDSNILISEETGFDKSSPEPFSFFVRKYPEARKFLYVADNPEKDFFHPNFLGWTSIMVPPHPDNVHPCSMPDDEFFRPAVAANHINQVRVYL